MQYSTLQKQYSTVHAMIRRFQLSERDWHTMVEIQQQHVDYEVGKPAEDS